MLTTPLNFGGKMQYTGPTWTEFYTKAMEVKKMTLEEAKKFAEHYKSDQAKLAIDKLMGTSDAKKLV